MIVDAEPLLTELAECFFKDYILLLLLSGWGLRAKALGSQVIIDPLCRPYFAR